MDLSTQEGTDGKHDSRGLKPQPHLGYDSTHGLTLQDKIIHSLLEQMQIGLVLNLGTNGLFVKYAIRLCSRGPDGRALTRIQDPELDTTTISGMGHGTTQGVHLLDQMPLAYSSYGRITTHLTNGLDIVRQ
jgi:hypothetical protein